MAGNKKSGDYGEKLAAEYLAGKGLAVTETNFRSRAGEIDIIARDGNYYVFVEVKLRRSLEKGYPREAVGYAKMNRLRRAALSYLAARNIGEADMRFDVVEIICDGGGVSIEHIENAF